jgi:hypothetical protein
MLSNDVVYDLNDRNYEFNLSRVPNCYNNLMFYRLLNFWIHNIHILKKKSVQIYAILQFLYVVITVSKYRFK